MTIEEVDLLVSGAKSARDLFGTDENKANELYRKLLAITHPDRNIDDKRANELYKEINRLWDLRKEPPAPPINSPGKHRYQPHRILDIGDIADLHFATDEDDREVVLKISRVQGGEVLMKNEATKVKKIQDHAVKGGKKTSYSHYFPELIEDFPAKDKFQKHVNVFVHEPGFYNLEKIHEKHPALDGRHIAWIFKRLLTAIGFANNAGIVHAAILPSHVRIYPGMAGQKDDKAHTLMLVGWGHSINDGEVIKTISTKYRSWYPPEVLGKKAAFPSTDIYLAAKCMVYLAGGDITTGDCPGLPKKMSMFLRSLLAEGQRMRPSEAWNLLEDFSDLLKSLYGPPKFHNLVMA